MEIVPQKNEKKNEIWKSQKKQAKKKEITKILDKQDYVTNIKKENQKGGCHLKKNLIGSWIIIAPP